MNGFYVSLIILIELMMLAMVIHVICYSGFKRNQKVWYLLTFIAVMFCSLSEFAVHCGVYDAKFKVILTIITVLQFSVAPMLGILFVGALGLRHQKRIAIAFLAINLLVEIILAPFGLVFYFDLEGYHRGNAFLVYTAFYFVSLAYLIGGMIIVGRKFSHRDILTIIMVIVIIIAGIIPMSIFKLNITYMAIAIAASICYIYYNDLVQQDIQAELVNNQKKISDMQNHMISGLANLIENRDMDTGEHISRTSYIVKTLSLNAKNDGVYSDVIDDHFIYLMYTLAPMHDIGKILIPDSILKKPGKLTPEEFEEMKKHATLGGSVVREVLNGVTDEEYLLFASDIATYHHERWDGTGYPNGLAQNDIPLCARIMAIADVYDALVSERCYKKAMSPSEALKIIEEESGSHFDPKLVQVFLNHKEEFISNE